MSLPGKWKVDQNGNTFYVPNEDHGDDENDYERDCEDDFDTNA